MLSPLEKVHTQGGRYLAKNFYVRLKGGAHYCHPWEGGARYARRNTRRPQALFASARLAELVAHDRAQEARAH